MMGPAIPRSALLARVSFALLLTAASGNAMAQLAPTPPATPVPEKIDVSTIETKMAEHNLMRAKTLHNYACDRVYKVENKRVNKSATLHATMVFIEPDEKLFDVRSYSGMGFLRKGVLNRLIETERENSRAVENQKTAFTPDNYDYEYLRSEAAEGRLQHVLKARARRKDKLLFNGIIWVDAQDGAVTRIEGRPAKNPSFWTRRVDFVQLYRKHGDYWFPERNSSATQVFIFGRTTTEIEYTNYRSNQPELLERAAELRRRGTKPEVQVDARDKESSPKP